MEEDALAGPFDMLEEARHQAHGLAQDGCNGRIEKRHEWRNLLCGRNWHLDSHDSDAIEIIEHF